MRSGLADAPRGRGGRVNEGACGGGSCLLAHPIPVAQIIAKPKGKKAEKQNAMLKAEVDILTKADHPNV